MVFAWGDDGGLTDLTRRHALSAGGARVIQHENVLYILFPVSSDSRLHLHSYKKPQILEEGRQTHTAAALSHWDGSKYTPWYSGGYRRCPITYDDSEQQADATNRPTD